MCSVSPRARHRIGKHPVDRGLAAAEDLGATAHAASLADGVFQFQGRS